MSNIDNLLNIIDILYKRKQSLAPPTTTITYEIDNTFLEKKWNKSEHNMVECELTDNLIKKDNTATINLIYLITLINDKNKTKINSNNLKSFSHNISNIPKNTDLKKLSLNNNCIGQFTIDVSDIDNIKQIIIKYNFDDCNIYTYTYNGHAKKLLNSAAITISKAVYGIIAKKQIPLYTYYILDENKKKEIKITDADATFVVPLNNMYGETTLQIINNDTKKSFNIKVIADIKLKTSTPNKATLDPNAPDFTPP